MTKKVNSYTSTSATVTISAATIRSVMPLSEHGRIPFYLSSVGLLPHPSGGVIAFASDGLLTAFAYDSNGTWLGSQDGALLLARNDGTWELSALRDVALLETGSREAVTFRHSGSGKSCRVELPSTGVGCTFRNAVSQFHFPRFPPFSHFDFAPWESICEEHFLRKALSCVQGVEVADDQSAQEICNRAAMYPSRDRWSLIVSNGQSVVVAMIPASSLFSYVRDVSRNARHHDIHHLAPEWLKTAFPSQVSACAC